MRKIKMLNRISIDGFFASLNDDTFGMDWFVHDPEVDKAAHEICGRLDTLILGGITYRGFERSWVPFLNDPNVPQQMKAVAEQLTQMLKVVFSKTLKESNWDNTKILQGDLLEATRVLKEEDGTDILVMGSGSIVQQLAYAGLIDEYVFIVSPVVAGGGKPLFPHISKSDLNLVEARTFQSGNVILHYELKK
ncbi:dihydrofolate reductase family protein [Paenibacillus harenae]|uniref:dihydrofolate reductase family protein n=1 Tax=Paenibacillus harenae TaxID=306543 RepID=UPI0003F8682A|nr:dihydrofolate reductase family protein [Paenibacillus harenae]